MKQWLIKASALCLVALLFFTLGNNSRVSFLRFTPRSSPERFESLRSTESNYQFVNPLLGCERPETASMREVRTLKQDVLLSVDAYKKQQKVDKISIYYRDLGNGDWFGINHDEAYIPASLMKVPIMIAYLRLSEIEPGLLSKKLVLHSATLPFSPEIKPINQISLHKPYSVLDLISSMIVYSDNYALEALVVNIDPSPIKEIFSDLGIAYEKIIDLNHPDFLSVKSYALLFRMLRNGTYLTRDNSEKALEILSKSEFKGGIAAGVEDKTIQIAHKFGERTLMDSQHQTAAEFHDCGIVYYPNKPYLLCIMTHGKSLQDLEESVRGISSLIYSSITPVP